MILLASLIVLVACHTAPSAQQYARATALGLKPIRVNAGAFTLVGHYGGAEQPGGTGRLHVYITGDGTPWIRGRRPAADPTPRQPVSLQLLAVDPGARVLLNRPCYGRLTPADACQTALWTSGRYSEAVVAVMDEALDGLRRRLGFASLVLIGYSGGGVLARLLAERRDDVAALVTIAANLDVAHWTDQHGYLPLNDSLDPARRPPLPEGLTQWHLVAGQDRTVAPESTRRGLSHEPGARLYHYPDFDHDCCWRRVWPEVLQRLTATLDGRPPPIQAPR
ncbi:alpha/beta hydrolase [Arhodomonas sp. SL1]|uniref:alpha/beta hydrolase n=1 Tax=Arhodomonas sp. SL1 TaxID=3425691 RepID=UPI003F884C33